MAAFPKTVDELMKFMEEYYGLVPKGEAVDEKKPTGEKKEAAPKSPPKKKVSEMTPQEKCEHHIADWTKKLEKSTDDDEKKKLQDKIDKENKMLANLVAGVPPEEKKPKGEKKTAAKKKAEPKGEKRVPKMTGAIGKHRKDAAAKVGYTLPESEKENDEFNKEMLGYVNGLSDEDYIKKNVKDHILDFVTNKKATEVADEDDDEEESETEESAPEQTSNAAGGGPGDLPELLKLDELQKLALTATLPGKPGVFMNAATGKFVTGPAADEDEDSTEVKFNGKEYAVGDKTGRVYECREEGDFFAGFCGVGQFKEMKV